MARGERCLPPPEPALLDAARSVLAAADLPILGMLAAGSPRDEIVATLRLGGGEFDHRIDAMVERLRHHCE